MQHTNSTFYDDKIKYYTIDCFNDESVFAFYTSSDNSKWKYSNGTLQNSMLQNAEFSKNYERLSKIISVPKNQMCTTNQTHTNVVRIINKENGGQGVIKPTINGDYDGIITNEKDLLLCSFEADCVPIYFYDSQKKVVAISHSGWKGTVSQIAKVTIQKMQNNFCCECKNIKVVIGPCACKKCYEVGKELINEFIPNFKNNIEQIFIPKYLQTELIQTKIIHANEKQNQEVQSKVQNNKDQKYFLDLQKAIEITLLNSGIKKENIYSVDKCTIEDNKLCSFRRTKSKVDHILTGIMLCN